MGDPEFCEHPLWRLPNPLPDDGTPCPVCGVLYVRPAWFAEYSLAELEQARAYWEIVSLWLLVAERRISVQEAYQERRRIARLAGWSSPPAALRRTS